MLTDYLVGFYITAESCGAESSILFSVNRFIKTTNTYHFTNSNSTFIKNRFWRKTKYYIIHSTYLITI